MIVYETLFSIAETKRYDSGNTLFYIPRKIATFIRIRKIFLILRFKLRLFRHQNEAGITGLFLSSWLK